MRKILEIKDCNWHVIIYIILGMVLLKVIHKNYKLSLSKKMYSNLSLALVSSLEAASTFNDIDTGQHTKRIGLYSKLIAEKLKLSKKIINEIGNVASLHDVGKIGIDHSILKKRGKLTREEFTIMETHTIIGYEILKKSLLGKTAENIALYHHEKWNGKGYPRGLRTYEIPIEARIVTVVDVYDALRQKRVYKEGIVHEEALKLIAKESGISFDPKIVNIFLENEHLFAEIYSTMGEKYDI